jgi:hypothetical protein
MSKTLSGPAWVPKFPGSKSVDKLEADFRKNVQSFLDALAAAKATVTVTSTLRPPERAYLMHWSWEIVKNGVAPSKVPPKPGVDIEWSHSDPAASRQAAQQMVIGYGINHLKVAPALNSRHIEGKAIDMVISWPGKLKIKDASGTVIEITSTPRDETNNELIKVGRTFGVVHLINTLKDRVHWSTDGH